MTDSNKLAPRSWQAAVVTSWAACIAVMLGLSGCGGDVTDPALAAPATSASAPASSSTTSLTPTINLSGTPAATAEVGNPYTFQPTASVNTGTVTFAISGLPSWATFDSTTGKLTGTPAAGNVGATGDITITASDGKSTATVAPFKIDVMASAAAPASNTVSLSWVAPTQNTNGTAVTDLAGYHIHYGTSTTALTKTIAVAGATTTEFEISNLSPGTYYFTVSAYNSLGAEGEPTGVVSKTI
jgi:hypothetical protein